MENRFSRIEGFLSKKEGANWSLKRFSFDIAIGSGWAERFFGGLVLVTRFKISFQNTACQVSIN